MDSDFLNTKKYVAFMRQLDECIHYWLFDDIKNEGYSFLDVIMISCFLLNKLSYIVEIQAEFF